MKHEINLRTKEFVVAREFHWPRVFSILAVLGLAAVLAAAWFLIYHHQLNLQAEIGELRSHKRMLETQVEPVIQMEAEIRMLKSRVNVDSSFHQYDIPWSSYLWNIAQVASWSGVSVLSVDSPDRSSINLRGTGPSMRHITLFVQSLEEQEFLARVKYRTMNLHGDGFSYDINAVIVTGGSD